MVTGLRFMMVKKKNQIKNSSADLNKSIDNHLSIQLCLDGFSFCIINENTHEISLIGSEQFDETPKTPEIQLEFFKKSFEDEKLLNKKYNSVNVTHVNNLSSLVPKPLFDPNHINSYIKYASKIYKNDYIVYDELENHDMYNVFIPFVNINNFLFEKFGSFEYKHFSTILIENILNTYKYSERPHLFAYLHRTHFEIVAIAENKLVLYNTFKYKTKEDFIYYILFTAEQLQFNPDKLELVLLGEIKLKDPYYNIAYEFIRNVSLLENRSKYSFSEEFDDFIKRKYYTLLNQF